MITVTIENGSVHLVQDGGFTQDYPIGTITCTLKRPNIIVMSTIEGKELFRAPSTDWTPNSLSGLAALGIYTQPPVPVDTTGLATESKQTDQLTELQALNASISAGINVNVTNQVDLTNLETTLSGVLTSIQSVDGNTNNIESLLSDVISEIEVKGTLNNTNLLAIVAELQTIEANTTQQETVLNSVVSNTTGIATAANQASEISLLTAIKILSDWRSENSNPFSVRIIDAQTSATIEYGLIAIRIKTGETNRVKIGSINAFVETNDDYSVYVYEYDRDQIALSVLGVVAWSDLGDRCEISVSEIGVPRIVITPGILKFSFMSRDVNNLSEKIHQDITNDTKEYLCVIHPHQTGADSYMGVNINEIV